MARKTDEIGVVPGTRLEQILQTLPRPERRLFLAVLTGAKTRRRDRLQRRLQRNMERKGIEA